MDRRSSRGFVWGIVVIAGVAGFAVSRMWSRDRVAHSGAEGTDERLGPDGEPGHWVKPWTPRSYYSESFNATRTLMSEDLLRRHIWDEEEAYLLADMMRRPFHQELDDAPDPDAYPIGMLEDRFLAGDAFMAYGERVQRRHAVTDRARAILDPIVLERLGDPSYSGRLNAMHTCFNVGLSDREDVRRHLVRMTKEDPDIRVRKVLERKFKVEDYFRAMREGRPWTPPKKAGAT